MLVLSDRDIGPFYSIDSSDRFSRYRIICLQLKPRFHLRRTKHLPQRGLMTVQTLSMSSLATKPTVTDRDRP